MSTRRHEGARQAIGLFDEAPAAGRVAEPVVDLWPAVDIAGERIDFAQPSAGRRAAFIISNLGDLEARRSALAQVPENHRDKVKDLVERAFYNAQRERHLARKRKK